MYTIDSFTIKECPDCNPDKNDRIDSILTACWWAVITVTTVGYGDIVPSTTIGKCFGSVAVFCGLIIIALPATIIVTRCVPFVFCGPNLSLIKLILNLRPEPKPEPKPDPKPDPKPELNP